MSIPVEKWEASRPKAPSQAAPIVRLVPRHVSFAGAGCSSVSQQAYDRLAAKFLANYRCMASHTCKELWTALDRGRADVAAGGEVSERQALRLKESMTRELTQLAALIVQSPSGAERVRLAGIANVGALSSLVKILDLSGDALYRVASESERTSARHAGEVTCAGMLECTECKGKRRHSRTVVVEPCPACGGRSFVKGF
jgi:hypothetical protein